MINGWLPFPVLSGMLLATWLLLNQSLALGHILLGSLLAVIGPLALLRLDAPKLTVRKPWAIARLASIVAVDAVRSNMRVARLILFDGDHRTPGFVRIQLSVRSPYGLAVLACIITATPGTSWVHYDPADNTLFIHVLKLVDDDDWGAIIKHRYENLLMEIFE